jgi:hypothetical protein
VRRRRNNVRGGSLFVSNQRFLQWVILFLCVCSGTSSKTDMKRNTHFLQSTYIPPPHSSSFFTSTYQDAVKSITISFDSFPTSTSNSARLFKYFIFEMIRLILFFERERLFGFLFFGCV